MIPSQLKPVYDHHDDLPHHIRTQLQSRIRKPAQNLEPDAKRLRLDAGKRAVLRLSHDVSSGPECCKPVTVFKSCENFGCADVLLTRRAANKEVQYDALVKSQQERVDAAMVREWDKWNEFGVTKFLSKKQLNDIMKRNPDQKIVGTRWVFTEKTIQGKPDYKARLVVQGCQEDKGYIRTDAPTGSRDAFFMTLSAASQSGWDYGVFDAQSAYLQSDGIKRLLLLRMPHKNPPPGTKPEQVFVATGSIYGTRDAGRAWYEHSKKVLEAAGFVESKVGTRSLLPVRGVSWSEVATVPKRKSRRSLDLSLSWNSEEDIWKGRKKSNGTKRKRRRVKRTTTTQRTGAHAWMG